MRVVGQRRVWESLCSDHPWGPLHSYQPGKVANDLAPLVVVIVMHRFFLSHNQIFDSYSTISTLTTAHHPPLRYCDPQATSSSPTLVTLDLHMCTPGTILRSSLYSMIPLEEIFPAISLFAPTYPLITACLAPWCETHHRDPLFTSTLLCFSIVPPCSRWETRHCHSRGRTSPPRGSTSAPLAPSFFPFAH